MYYMHLCASFISSREHFLHSFYYIRIYFKYIFRLAAVDVFSNRQEKKKLDAWKQRGNEAEKSTAQWVENNSSLQLTSFIHTIVF